MRKLAPTPGTKIKGMTVLRLMMKLRWLPLWRPKPVISPLSLMPVACVSVQPEAAGIRLFRSRKPFAASQMKAC